MAPGARSDARVVHGLPVGAYGRELPCARALFHDQEAGWSIAPGSPVHELLHERGSVGNVAGRIPGGACLLVRPHDAVEASRVPPRRSAIAHALHARPKVARHPRQSATLGAPGVGGCRRSVGGARKRDPDGRHLATAARRDRRDGHESVLQKNTPASRDIVHCLSPEMPMFAFSALGSVTSMANCAARYMTSKR